MVEKTDIVKQPKRNPDDRTKWINELVSDCREGYCTARMILEEGKKEVAPCPYAGNCRGEEWCENREKVYLSPSTPFTLVQMKEVERVKYLDSERQNRDETLDEAVRHWTDLQRGGAAIFRYVYEELKIRSLAAIDRLCVFAVVDTDPLLNKKC